MYQTESARLIGETPQFTTSGRRWFPLGVAFFVLGMAAIPLSWWIRGDDWWVHGLWCAVGIAFVLPTLTRVLRDGFRIVLTDHLVMFVGAFALYFLFGALLLVVGPEAEIQHALAYYPIDARDAMRVDAVNGVGFGLALMAASLSNGRWLARQADRMSAVTSKVTVEVAVPLFLILGAAASLNVLAVDLGLREGIVSGAWRAAGKFSLVAIFLGCAHKGRGEKSMRLFAVVVALVEAAGGLLLFSKTATLLPLAAIVAGYSTRYRRRFVIPVGVAVLVIIFVSIGGLVGFSRSSLGVEVGGPVARWQALSEGLARLRGGGGLTGYAPWARLSYTPPQAAALDFYDAGIGGDEIRLIPWLFVPRALAVNKPIITQSSADFHTKITGREGSSTGQGIFASGYYNAGWLGVLFASVLCGWILAQTSAIARAILNRRAILLLPLALLGVYMAFRIDGHFLADYLGLFVFVLYPLLATPFLTVVRQRTG